MTETSTDAGPARAVAGAGERVDVRSLDDQSVLDGMREARRAADRAEAGLLRFAVHYVDLHPVTDEHPAATPGDGDRCLHDEPATTGDPVGLGGDGTPGIAEYAVEALGAHLSLSYRATIGLLGDAVELCHRLPRLWDLVQAGRLQAWKARQVTAHTRSVSAAAAGFVDRHLARDAARNRVPTLSRLRALTHEALLQCDPDTAEGREEAALAARDVTFDHRAAASTGVSTMTATLDTLDAFDLHHTLTEMATTMGHLGDTSPIGVRRAHALGMLARPDRVLDLFTDQPGDQPVDQFGDDLGHAAGASPDEVAGDGRGAAGCGNPGDPARSRPSSGHQASDECAGGQRERDLPPVLGTPFNRTTATLFVHVDAGDLHTDTHTDTDTGTGSGGVGTVERLGAATLELIRDWLGRSSHLTLRPVLHARGSHREAGTVTDPRIPPCTPPNDSAGSARGPGDGARTDPCCTPVDRHDPPPAMREAVIQRDGHCVFPGCTTDARSCDLDHIVAYLDPDDGGPPGQTSFENLGCLCRRHHRLKTFTAWTYRRRSDGDYEWTSPAGNVYLAAPTPKTAPHHA